MNSYRTRVALSVFANAADLALAVDDLLAAGIAPENLIRVPPDAEAGIGADLRHLIAPAEGTLLERTPSPADAIATLGDLAPPRMAAALTAALAAGAVILLVVVGAPGTEQAVSRMLLASAAQSVQLHDLGV